MKQSLLSILLSVLFLIPAVAQDYEFEFLEDEFKTFRLSDQGSQSVILKGLVRNISSSDIEFTWTREVVYIHDDWKTQICDKNRCYFANVNTQSFTLAAGDTSNLDVYLLPNRVSGDSAIINLHLSTSENNAEDRVITYRFYQEQTSSSFSAAKESEVLIYPNPASTYFRISSERAMGSVEIFDILGKQIKAVYPQSTNTYSDVIGLLKGIYIVRIKDMDGNIIKTQRLRKEMP